MSHTIIKAMKFRLYPTKGQEAVMRETLYLTRQLYNAALESRRDAYRKKKITLTAYDQQKELTELKEVCPEYKRVYSHVLQDVLERLDKSFKGFFARIKRGEKAGYPRFKGANRWDSFKFKQCWDNKRGDWTACGRPTEDGKRISIPKIGNVKCKFHRPLEGKPKNLQIVLDVDEWYAVYTCEIEVQPRAIPTGEVGIDLGTTWFAVTSDGEFVDNPRHLHTVLGKLKTQQRTVSRRKKGSGRRKKAAKCVAKTHQKVRRSRLDFHHKTARKLVDENGLIAHENLNVGGMVKSNLARSISDVGWSQFLSILEFKAEEAGVRVCGVDPRYTSQRCNACGHTSKANRVNQAQFVCRECGHRANADHNAALNILGRAVPSSDNGKEGIYAVV